MIKILFSFKGNARACVYTEPLWAIPYFLYVPFFTLYKNSLGLSDVQIGTVLSIGLVFQVISAFAGGALTDKFGRRYTLFIFDIISWTIPCLLWAFAKDIRWFIAAAIINSMQQISATAWHCTLVEDTKSEQIVPIFNWINICGQLVVFFVPISGFLVSRYDLIPVMRGLFIFSTILMTFKFIFMFILSTETNQGKKRLAETKDESVSKLLAGLKNIFLKAINNPATVTAVLISTVSMICVMIAGNFFSLYVTQNLNVPQIYIAWFPIIRAVVMLTFFFLLQRYFSRMPLKRVMIISLGLFTIAHILLIISPWLPINMLSPVIIFTIFDASATALFMPRREAILAFNVEPGERARIMSIVYALSLAAMSPFGWIAGLISSIDRRLPFMFNLLLFGVLALLVVRDKGHKEVIA